MYKKSYPKVSVSTKVSAICDIGSIGISENLRIGIGIGGNFGIGAALLKTDFKLSPIYPSVQKH